MVCLAFLGIFMLLQMSVSKILTHGYLWYVKTKQVEIIYLLTVMYSIPFNKLLCFPPSFFRSEWPGQASEQQPVKQRKHRIIDPYKLYGPHGYRWFNLRKFFTDVQISQKMCQITILNNFTCL